MGQIVGANWQYEPCHQRPRRAMTASTSSRAINVQPHPRLLSILGDIEFAP